MERSDGHAGDVTVQVTEIRHQAKTLATTRFTHKERRRTPCSWVVDTFDDVVFCQVSYHFLCFLSPVERHMTLGTAWYNGFTLFSSVD